MMLYGSNFERHYYFKLARKMLEKLENNDVISKSKFELLQQLRAN